MVEYALRLHNTSDPTLKNYKYHDSSVNVKSQSVGTDLFV